MKVKLTVFFFLFFQLSYSQTPTFQWVKTFYSSSNNVSASLVRTDHQSNVIIAGIFEGPSDFDPGPGTFTMSPNGFGGYDAFICKLDPAGNFIWARQLNGEYNSFINAMMVDNVGNIYTTGAFYTNTVIANTYDGFVWKLNSSGTTIFNALMGGSIFDNGIGLCLDPNKNIYTTGILNSGVADMDPGPGVYNLNASTDGYLSKLDSMGNFVWAGLLNCNGFIIEEWSIAQAKSAIFHCGRFNGQTDFDLGTGTSTLTSSGTYDGYLSKLDLNGNFVWGKQIGGPKDDMAWRILSDSNGDLLLTGTIDSIADLDPGTGTYTVDATVVGPTYILKLDTAGNLIWAKHLFCDIREFSLDALNNIYTTGNIYSWLPSADMDPGPGTFTLNAGSAYANAYMSKLDANGNFQWAVALQDTGWSGGASIHADNSGAIYTAGNFNGRVDFDHGLGTFTLAAASPTNDAFVHKMMQGPLSITSLEKNESELKVFPNPFSDRVNIWLSVSAKKIEVRIYNMLGQILMDRHFSENWFVYLDTREISSGACIVDVVADGIHFRKKLLKE
jgi:hypothetical protein